jgi:hypothetical protein
MKRILLLLGLAAVLAMPVAVSAAAGTDGTLSVRKGHATVVLKLKGTTIGRMARGTIRIRDLNPYDDAFPQIRHCRLRYPNATTATCTGKKIVFRVLDGRFTVRLKGSGIYLSAVGRGSVTMQGLGALPASSGLMSLDSGPYQPIPDVLTTFPIGTSASRP